MVNSSETVLSPSAPAQVDTYTHLETPHTSQTTLYRKRETAKLPEGGENLRDLSKAKLF